MSNNERNFTLKCNADEYIVCMDALSAGFSNVSVSRMQAPPKALQCRVHQHQQQSVCAWPMESGRACTNPSTQTSGRCGVHKNKGMMMAPAAPRSAPRQPASRGAAPRAVSSSQYNVGQMRCGAYLKSGPNVGQRCTNNAQPNGRCGSHNR